MSKGKNNRIIEDDEEVVEEIGGEYAENRPIIRGEQASATFDDEEKEEKDDEAPIEQPEFEEIKDEYLKDITSITPSRFIDVMMTKSGYRNHLEAINGLASFDYVEIRKFIGFLSMLPVGRSLVELESLIDPQHHIVNMDAPKLLALMRPDKGQEVIYMPAYDGLRYLFQRYPKLTSQDQDGNVVFGGKRLECSVKHQKLTAPDLVVVASVTDAKVEVIDIKPKILFSLRAVAAAFEFTLKDGYTFARYNGKIVAAAIRDLQKFAELKKKLEVINNQPCQDTFLFSFDPISYLFKFGRFVPFVFGDATIQKAMVPHIEKDIKECRSLIRSDSDVYYKSVMEKQRLNKEARKNVDTYIQEMDYRYPVAHLTKKDRRLHNLEYELRNKYKFSDLIVAPPADYDVNSSTKFIYVETSLSANPSEEILSSRLNQIMEAHKDAENIKLHMPIMYHFSRSLDIIANFFYSKKFISTSYIPPYQAHDRYLIYEFSRVESKNKTGNFALNDFRVSSAAHFMIWLRLVNYIALSKLDTAENRYMNRCRTGMWEHDACEKVVAYISKRATARFEEADLNNIFNVDEDGNEITTTTSGKTSRSEENLGTNKKAKTTSVSSSTIPLPPETKEQVASFYAPTQPSIIGTNANIRSSPSHTRTRSNSSAPPVVDNTNTGNSNMETDTVKNKLTQQRSQSKVATTASNNNVQSKTTTTTTTSNVQPGVATTTTTAAINNKKRPNES